jgi:hypothetical protein
MSRPRLSHALSACLVAALALPAVPVRAAGADDLRDLVGAKGRDGESELERRGYTHIDTAKSSSAAYSYWWSNAGQSCVRVTTRDGRYDAIANTDLSDCGQTKKESRNNNAAAIAVGAAALLGVAALAHKSHQRDDKQYNEQQTADFERGYRDGLYHQPYHNYSNTREYSDGYNKGVDERSRQTSYRPYEGWHSGYAGYVNLQDLNGARASSADDQLRTRGFAPRGAYKEGGRSIGMWWNGNTRQCVHVVVADGRVANVSAIPEGNCL